MVCVRVCLRVCVSACVCVCVCVLSNETPQNPSHGCKVTELLADYSTSPMTDLSFSSPPARTSFSTG